MDVVAEGAETDSDAVELYQLGCEYAQGYAFGEPMTPEAARKLLLSEQLEPVRRKVALKVIRFGMDTERVIERFEMERQSQIQNFHSTQTLICHEERYAVQNKKTGGSD